MSFYSFYQLLQLISEAVFSILTTLTGCNEQPVAPSRIPANATTPDIGYIEKNKSRKRWGSKGTPASTIMNISMLNMHQRSPPFMSVEVSSHVHVAPVLTTDSQYNHSLFKVHLQL